MSVKILNLKKESTNVFADKIKSKHPKLALFDVDFHDIIVKWTKSDLHNINYTLKYLRNNIIDQVISGENNIENIIEKCSKKYLLFHRHKFLDFALIRFANDFYGNDINELESDAMKLINLDHLIFKINNPGLISQIKHIIICDILIMFGILFYYLKIAVLTGNIFISSIDDIGHAVITSILKKQPCKLNDVKFIFESEETSRGLKIVKKMYKNSIRYINRLNIKNGELEKHLSDFPDYILFDLHNKKPNVLFSGKHYYLIAICEFPKLNYIKEPKEYNLKINDIKINTKLQIQL